MTTYSAPICMVCMRLKKGDVVLTCDAYPEGVPEAIYTSVVDHRQPQEGDGGLQFSPVDDEAVVYANALFPNS